MRERLTCRGGSRWPGADGASPMALRARPRRDCGSEAIALEGGVDHGVPVERGDAGARAAERGARVAEDDEALRPDGRTRVTVDEIERIVI